MIKLIECYQTADGQIFQSEQQAERHADDLLGKELETFIEFAFPDNVHKPSQYKAAIKLLENKEQAKAMLRDLLRILAHGGGSRQDDEGDY